MSTPTALPRGNNPGRDQQHRATPAAEVEHPLVAAQAYPGQQACPHLEFSSPAEAPYADARSDQQDGNHSGHDSGQRSPGRQQQAGQNCCGKAQQQISAENDRRGNQAVIAVHPIPPARAGDISCQLSHSDRLHR
jgi:hypothetical protein